MSTETSCQEEQGNAFQPKEPANRNARYKGNSGDPEEMSRMFTKNVS
jgi:hypothetical protein